MHACLSRTSKQRYSTASFIAAKKHGNNPSINQMINGKNCDLCTVEYYFVTNRSDLLMDAIIHGAYVTLCYATESGHNERNICITYVKCSE